MNSCEICGVPLIDTIPHNVFGYNVCSECKANTPVERFSCPKCNASSVLAPFYKDVTIECPKCKTEYVAKKDAVRYNKDKLRVDLIPTEFIEEVAKVFTFGAKKYSPNNWKGFNESQQNEILGSLLRHILEYQKGNKFDDESGLHHLAHAACNIAFILYFENKEAK